METIIYSQHFEPITCVEIPAKTLLSAQERGGLTIALTRTDKPVVRIPVSIVDIKWPDGSDKPVLVAQDEESVLLLNPSWLPGQRAVVGAYRRSIKTLRGDEDDDKYSH